MITKLEIPKDLLELEWRKRLCPFETVKKWKHGFSLKCPMETQVGWCSVIDEGILRSLRTKRSLKCVKCKEKMLKFLKER